MGAGAGAEPQRGREAIAGSSKMDASSSAVTWAARYRTRRSRRAAASSKGAAASPAESAAEKALSSRSTSSATAAGRLSSRPVCASVEHKAPQLSQSLAGSSPTAASISFSSAADTGWTSTFR